MLVEQFRQSFNETRVPLRGAVLTNQLRKRVIVEQLLHSLFENSFELRNASRVAAAEHQQVVVGGCGLADVVHQLDDSGIGREGLRFAMDDMTEPKVLLMRGLSFQP